MAKKKSNIVRFEDVRDRIVTIRGEEVILDFAVAELYGVETILTLKQTSGSGKGSMNLTLPS